MKVFVIVLVVALAGCGGASESSMEKSMKFVETSERLKGDILLEEKLQEYVSYIELYKNNTLESEFREEALLLINGLVSQLDSTHLNESIEILNGDSTTLLVGGQKYKVELIEHDEVSSRMKTASKRSILKFNKIDD